MAKKDEEIIPGVTVTTCFSKPSILIREVGVGSEPSKPQGYEQMVVCPECGNKRCPHAADHRAPCTGSNALGQPGSDY